MLLATTLALALADDDGAAHFRATVAPLLERRCLSCHTPGNAKGGLSLADRAAALKGGEEGPALVPGKPDESLLLLHVSGPKPAMPKAGAKLSAAEVAALRQWLAAGAPWPASIALKPPAEAEWWSLRPIAKPGVPASGHSGSAHPVDRFLDEARAAKGLKPAPRASRATLLRRATFDLIGLPPTPEEFDAFAADPRTDVQAYAALLDRLLASPRYGERWARHWLDLAGYAETHGYDKDQPRPHAWPYRDYVIRAFNEDKPYARFVKEQIAGDAAYPGTRDGVEALGFLAAGPWDLIGHAEVPETKLDGRIARHLDRDDMVARTMQAFVGLTVQCAQCHDHKFDPISQADYYSLHAVFAAVDKADRKYDADPQVAARRAAATGALAKATAERTQLENSVADPRIALLKTRIVEAGKSSRPAEYGYHSAFALKAETTKWVQIDLGSAIPLTEIVLRSCDDDFAGIGPGFCFPVRYRVELCARSDFSKDVTVVADRTAADQPNPKRDAVRVDANGKAGRYVRIVATKLAHRQNDYCFALAEVEALDRNAKNVAAGKAVSALDGIEAPVRWANANLTDGKYPTSPRSAEAIAKLQAEHAAAVQAGLPPEQAARWRIVQRELVAARSAVAALPPQPVCYVAAVHAGSGAFRGTGHERGIPRPIQVLERGDLRKPLRPIGPGALAAVKVIPARPVESQPDEARRRLWLSEWLTARDQPLTWRVIVNRVWRHHFGLGIVETPSDLGRQGELPTHSALLDWLAAEFRDGPQSLKRLHKLLMTSAAYCQSADGAPHAAAAAFAQDPDNRSLWRQRRRRLEAEVLRDGMLLVAGKLDLAMGGPSFRDFVIEKPEHSPHYQYHLANPDDPATHRRSIHRFVVRSQPQPLLAALGCADPTQSVDRRLEGTSPALALGLLNNGFVAAMCKHAAAKFAALPGGLDRQVERAVRESLGRPPSAAERAALVAYARDHGLANLCRLLFNLNEFAFVD